MLSSKTALSASLERPAVPHKAGYKPPLGLGALQQEATQHIELAHSTRIRPYVNSARGVGANKQVLVASGYLSAEATRARRVLRCCDGSGVASEGPEHLRCWKGLPGRSNLDCLSSVAAWAADTLSRKHGDTGTRTGRGLAWPEVVTRYTLRRTHCTGRSWKRGRGRGSG